MYILLFVAQCTRGCFNGGYCDAPETCVCNTGWGGVNCTQGLFILKLHMQTSHCIDSDTLVLSTLSSDIIICFNCKAWTWVPILK